MNGTHSSINKVLVLGDHRIVTSIISGLSYKSLDIHQVVHPQSTSESTHYVTVHKTNLSANILQSLLRTLKPDILFSTQSAGSYDFQKQIIDIAIKENVTRFVPAEFKEDASNKKLQDKLPPVEERARVIQYLQEQASHSRIEWVGIATGCDIEQGLISGNLGFDLKWQSAMIHETGNERFAASSTAWIGKVAAGIIENWEDIKGQYLYASGMITSAHEILECIKEKTSQQWAVGYTDVEDIVHEAERRFERGFPDAGMFLMERSIWFDEALNASAKFVQDDAKRLLGIAGGEVLEDVVQRVLHAVKHHSKGDCGCE